MATLPPDGHVISMRRRFSRCIEARFRFSLNTAFTPTVLFATTVRMIRSHSRSSHRSAPPGLFSADFAAASHADAERRRPSHSEVAAYFLSHYRVASAFVFRRFADVC